MNKKGFTIIEVFIVFLLILGVTFFILPLSLNNTRQAKFTSTWVNTYSEIEYVFSAIIAQNELNLEEKFKRAKSNDYKTAVVLDVIKPYLRFKSGVPNNQYKPLYMNKKTVIEGDRYYFDNFYFWDEDKIFGLKWLSENCNDEIICASMLFDINGINLPNTWGKDIFGINIFKNKIEPIGKNVNRDILKNDCSRFGFGVYCSYYYLIGGEFE